MKKLCPDKTSSHKQTLSLIAMHGFVDRSSSILRSLIFWRFWYFVDATLVRRFANLVCRGILARFEWTNCHVITVAGLPTSRAWPTVVNDQRREWRRSLAAEVNFITVCRSGTILCRSCFWLFCRVKRYIDCRVFTHDKQTEISTNRLRLIHVTNTSLK